MTWRVIVGTISIVGTMILLGLVAVTEQDRMTSFTRAYDSRKIEAGAAIFESNCALCHASNGKGVPGKGPALNDVELFNGTRTKEIAWAGSVDNFVRTTIASGRPRASQKYIDYAERMPTWGEEYGGPLRQDQVDALTAFIMNWKWAYTDATGNFIGTPTPIPDAVGSDLAVTLPEGDAANGKALVTAQGCEACHVLTDTGPAWMADKSPSGKGLATHAEDRLADPNYAGNANGEVKMYLLESFIQPNAYIVPDDAKYVNAATGKSVMPETYANSLSKQQAADILAYLLTIK